MAEGARGRIVGVAIAALALAAMAGAAAAQSSIGIGSAEVARPPAPDGLFAGLMNWINQQQQAFYKALTGALRDMREEPGAVMVLIGLSFAYGVFHAAGPGHGKAVISSYMLANEVALRRGVVLAFVSSMLQAITAILVIGAVFLFLRGTAIRQTDAVWTLEIASYALIAGFGLWLLARKLLALLRRRANAPALALAGAGAGQGHRRHAHRHDHGPGETCATCGHAHMPDPAALSGKELGLRDAWTAVVAVGLRPCTGALIVLTFAFLNGLWWGGIAAVFAMAAGTAITVSMLATLAVTAKNVAVRFAGGGSAGTLVHDGIEIAGATLVLLLGLTLLTAALSV